MIERHELHTPDEWAHLLPHGIDLDADTVTITLTRAEAAAFGGSPSSASMAARIRNAVRCALHDLVNAERAARRESGRS